MSPVPLSSEPAVPTHGITEVADGSTVPTTGSPAVGCSTLLTAPTLREALAPQSAIEKSCAFTVLHAGQLQVLSTASSQHLLDAARVATPAVSTSATHGEYFLPSGTLLPFLPTAPCHPPPPSSHAGAATKTASTARYYASKLSNLKDLALYWHTALEHASEERLTHTARHQLVPGLPAQLTAPATRKYFKRLRIVSAVLLLHFSSLLTLLPSHLLPPRLVTPFTLTLPSRLALLTRRPLLVLKLLAGTRMLSVLPILVPAVHSLFYQVY